MLEFCLKVCFLKDEHRTLSQGSKIYQGVGKINQCVSVSQISFKGRWLCFLRGENLKEKGERYVCLCLFFKTEKEGGGRGRGTHHKSGREGLPKATTFQCSETCECAEEGVWATSWAHRAALRSRETRTHLRLKNLYLKTLITCKFYKRKKEDNKTFIVSLQYSEETTSVYGKMKRHRLLCSYYVWKGNTHFRRQTREPC